MLIDKYVMKQCNVDCMWLSSFDEDYLLIKNNYLKILTETGKLQTY